MPKASTATNKRSGILSYILNSRTCHTLKDLEKSIPSSVAGVSPMQVKDYLQNLLDEDELRVEKIGSGNWYWSFGAADLLKLQNGQKTLEAERQKLEMEMELLKSEKQQIEDERKPDDIEADERIEVQRLLSIVEKETEILHRELTEYSDFDPSYLEKLQEQLDLHKGDAEKWTEMIHSMAGWVKTQTGVGRDAFAEMQRSWYGEEWDEEEGELKEL